MQLETEARRIIDLLKNHFTFEDGGFFLEKNGETIFPYHIYADMGDFLPFFLYFGEIGFVNKQVSLYTKSLNNGLLVSEFPSFRIRNLVKSYEYTDLLLGLSDLYEMSPAEENKRLLLDAANSAINVFNLNSKISSLFYFPLKIKLPIIDSRDSTFIEIFVDIYRLTNESKYKGIAKNIFDSLTSIDWYKKEHLMPTFSSPVYLQKIFQSLGFGKKYYTSNICKNTTNTLFGFLSLAQSGEERAFDEIEKIVTKLANISEEINGAIPENYDPIKLDKVSNLTATFPVIDFLCDLFVCKKNDKYKHIAMRLSDFWISKQGRTGLFPLRSDSNESFFDAETDMSVALMKLWEVTGIDKYQKSAQLCFEGITKYHGAADYCLSVDIDSGEVLNRTQRTKFIALFLKLIILMMEYKKGEKIYKNKGLHGLLRDR